MKKDLVSLTPKQTIAVLRGEREASEAIVDPELRRRFKRERENLKLALTAAIKRGLAISTVEGLTETAGLLADVLEFSSRTAKELRDLASAVKAGQAGRDAALRSEIIRLTKFAYGDPEREARAKAAKEWRDEHGVTEAERRLEREQRRNGRDHG